MRSKMIPAEESFIEWRKNPAYREATDALDEEFAVFSAGIETSARQISSCLPSGSTKPR